MKCMDTIERCKISYTNVDCTVCLLFIVQAGVCLLFITQAAGRELQYSGHLYRAVGGVKTGEQITCYLCTCAYCLSKWPYILSDFDEAAHTMGLNTSWSKTKTQNLGHGVTPVPVQLQGSG